MKPNNELNELAHKLAIYSAYYAVECISKLANGDGTRYKPELNTPENVVQNIPAPGSKIWLEIDDWEGLQDERRYLILLGVIHPHPTNAELYQFDFGNLLT